MKLTILRSVSTTDGLLVEGSQPDVNDKLAAILVKRGYAEAIADAVNDAPDEVEAPAPTTTRKPRKPRK